MSLSVIFMIKCRSLPENTLGFMITLTRSWRRVDLDGLENVSVDTLSLSSHLSLTVQCLGNLLLDSE